MQLGYFKTDDFHTALQRFFKELNIPVNYIAEEPVRAEEILENTYKADHASFQLINDVYFLGMVDDATFEDSPSLAPEKIASDYDGILIFGVTLKPRDNQRLPTRSQLAEITRAFNREYHYTPVVVVFKYANYIAFANAERLKYQQVWREGEKAGKVSLLRDLNLNNPHSGHLRILSELKITRSGKKAVNSFAELYSYWQSVFNVSLLSKKFYEELSNWYFWAVKETRFPAEPKIEMAGDIDANRHEHNAKNIIRLLTRFLFVWFIKEKKLIPSKLFDIHYLEKSLLKEVSPFRGDFYLTNEKSHYYKAVLQNLFFATLNQEMGKREFRKDKQHMNVTTLLRYESFFKKPEAFISLVESIVPFMNGGLFECLDQPHPTAKGRQGGEVIVYKDGFSDRADNDLIVPDYLFFGTADEVDLSTVIGINNKKTKQAAVKGLINIFESYKFTIAENTPIEEDIALDPELLGKVFENLLASYNPETKTTARKQTGSFYTPREIVNYMVDESLIAYLKTAITDWQFTEVELDKQLHELFAFNTLNPFAGHTELQIKIIKALDHCSILDPACGSGAFPMGVLQKMVHILQKLDPDNNHWQELQLENAIQETESVFQIGDKQARQLKLTEINEAFDQQTNDPDYARKLFLIENCIYGVDIQPIAVQISKLRFFISLVAEQKVDKNKDNFGIRPLPNLETKFVAANTLIGIEKSHQQQNIFDSPAVRELEGQLKAIRHRIFSAKTPSTKRKLREEDKDLRQKMGELLIAQGLQNKTAQQLAEWDPYNQNTSSAFFDSEWMFSIQEGFDVVIGNPPYIQIQKFSGQQCQKDWEAQNYKTYAKTGDIYTLFYEQGNNFLKKGGHLCFITSNKWMRAKYGMAIRNYFSTKTNPLLLIDFGGFKVFESATVDTNILLLEKQNNSHKCIACSIGSDFTATTNIRNYTQINETILSNLSSNNWVILNKKKNTIKEIIESIGLPLKNWDITINYGIKTGFNDAFIISKETKDKLVASNPKYSNILKPVLRGKDIKKYKNDFSDLWLIFIPWHFPLHKDNRINGNSSIAEEEFQKEYPHIYNHLLKFKEKLSKRNKSETGVRYEWYALQRCASTYHSEFEKNKIIYQEIVQESSFIFDSSKQYYCLDTGRIITGNNLKFLLSILNSKLFFYSVKYFYGGGALGSTGVRMKHTFFENFPIPKITEKNQRPFKLLVSLITCSKEINLKNNAKTIELITDGLVFQLYFPAHMQEKQIDILQFVEKDLAEVMQNREFETLPETEKEAIIKQLHAKWTHPDSEVRNRIKLFAVRSPDILKPIMES